jgi:HPt (histidine-containing phosphotransfer) domain-containing protein
MPQSAIDIVHLRVQCAGDAELERDLLDLFSQQCCRQLRAIHAAPDGAARRDAAHTLKGAARAIGAWQVAEAADRIEQLDDVAGLRGEAALDALALAAAEARAAIETLRLAA